MVAQTQPTAQPRTPLSPEDSALFSLFVNLHFSLPALSQQTDLPIDTLADWADRQDIRERTETIQRLAAAHFQARDAEDFAIARLTAVRGLAHLARTTHSKEELRRATTTLLRHTTPSTPHTNRAPSPREFAGSTRSIRTPDAAPPFRAAPLPTNSTFPSDSSISNLRSSISCSTDSDPIDSASSPTSSISNLRSSISSSSSASSSLIARIFLNNTPADPASLDHCLRALHARCVPSSRINRLPVPTDPSAFTKTPPAPLATLLSTPITNSQVTDHSQDGDYSSTTYTFSHPHSPPTTLTFSQYKPPDDDWRIESLDIEPAQNQASNLEPFQLSDHLAGPNSA